MSLRPSQLKTLELIDQLAQGGWVDAKALSEKLRITVRSAERRLARLSRGPGLPALECVEALGKGWKGWPEVNVYRLTEAGQRALTEKGSQK